MADTLTDECRNEHPGGTGSKQNTNSYGPLNGHTPRTYGNESRNLAGNSRSAGGQLDNRDRDREIKHDLIRSELSTERPIWILSCFSPRADLPRQLFSGPDRELSPEEVRLRHYELAAQGKTEEAVREAQALYQAAQNQNESVLRDVAGAVKYLQSGFDVHPNRIDICREYKNTGSVASNGSFATPTSNLGTGAFGKPSTLGGPSAFTNPSKLGVPSIFGQSSVLNQPSLFGQIGNQLPQSSTAAAFGKPSSISNQTVAFGQPSIQGNSAQPSIQPAFGQPSSVNNQNTMFGQPSGIGANTTFGGRTTNPAFGQPSKPFPQQQNGGTSAFGQPSGLFGQKSGADSSLQQPLAQGAFGAPLGSTISGSGQSNFGGQMSERSTFGAPPVSTAFGQASTLGNNSPFSSQGQANSIQFSSSTSTGEKLQNWHGKQVQYIKDQPCFKLDDGRWQRIWFAEGPPTWGKPEDLPNDPPYDDATEERYKFAKQNGIFKDGVPLLPPKREWTSWDF